MADKPPKKDPSDKMKALIKAREEARAELTAALGKGARVANAAAYFSKAPAERLAFIEQIKRRNAAAAEAKTAAKEAGKKVEGVKKEAKNLAKTAKKNAKKAASASKAAAAAAVAANAGKSKGKTKKVQYFKFPYDSVEREAKKLAKKAEELQAKLTSVGVELKDVCKLCKDFQEETPKKA